VIFIRVVVFQNASLVTVAAAHKFTAWLLLLLKARRPTIMKIFFVVVAKYRINITSRVCVILDT